MKLVIIFLNKVEYLEDLLSAFLEIGISGATVVDSVGMWRVISYNIPIFAGLRDAFAGSSPGNKIVFTVVEDKHVEDIATVAQDVCGSFDDPGTGMMVTLPLDKVYGFRPGLE